MKSLIGLALAIALGVSVAASVASGPPQTTTPAPAAAQQKEDPLKFDRAGRMLLVYQVPAAEAQDFALTWRTIKDELTKLNDPGLTAFSASLDIQRVQGEPGADAVFVFDLDPVSTTYSYHPVTLLFETLKENPETPGVGLTYDQATALFEKVKNANATTWWLSPV